MLVTHKFTNDDVQANESKTFGRALSCKLGIKKNLKHSNYSSSQFWGTKQLYHIFVIKATYFCSFSLANFYLFFIQVGKEGKEKKYNHMKRKIQVTSHGRSAPKLALWPKGGEVAWTFDAGSRRTCWFVVALVSTEFVGICCHWCFAIVLWMTYVGQGSRSSHGWMTRGHPIDWRVR